MIRAPAAVRRTLRRLGSPGVAGIGVLVAYAAMYVSATQPLGVRVDALRAEVARLERQLATGSAGPLGPEQALESFYGHFSTGMRAEQWLERLHALARASGLEMPQGSYRYAQQASERLARYEVTLPLKGSYRQMRRFIAAALNEIPVASLDRVSFERKRAADPQVEATFRFTLFLDERTAERKQP